MTGQDAVTTAESFHQTLALDGVILTKLDGDARGGAALVGERGRWPTRSRSLRPVRLSRTFEQFHPDRMANRILGMGDVLTLIEKAEQVYEEEEAEVAARKLLDGTFTFDDFLEQMQQIKKMGDLSSLVAMMPGVPKEMKNAQIDDREMARVEAIVYSMTPQERTTPEIIDGSRRVRIANGSGTSASQVSALIKQFGEMKKMMKGMAGTGFRKAKAKKSKKKGKKGGRVTPSKKAAATRVPFELPGR